VACCLIRMEKEDVRKQTLEKLHERRKQVERLRSKGHKVMKIVKLTGLTCPTDEAPLIYSLRDGGQTPRGRAKGVGRVLTDDQEKQIQHATIDKRAQQLKMISAYGVVRR
jgi:hypothetical protein